MNCRLCTQNVERRIKAEKAEEEAHSLMCRATAHVMVLKDLITALKTENQELRNIAGVSSSAVVFVSKKTIGH